MPITFLPTQVLKKIMPEKKVARLITNDLTLNRATLNALSGNSFMSKKTAEKIALKVLKGYKSRYKDALKEGLSKSASISEALAGKKLLIDRVQNAAVYEISQEVKKQYEGERAVWLPSDAETPDPLHQLNYGKKFWVGVGIDGEQPGDRYGCKCGIRILTEEDELYLEDDESFL